MHTVNNLKIQSPVSDRVPFRNSFTAVLSNGTAENLVSSPRISKDFKLKKGLIHGRRPKPVTLTNSRNYQSPRSINNIPLPTGKPKRDKKPEI